MGLVAGDPVRGLGESMQRVSDADFGGEVYLTHFSDGVQGVTPTQDLSGTLRLTRSGGMLTGYYHDGTDFVPVHSVATENNRIHLRLAAWTENPTPGGVIALDNFQVQADEIICPHERIRQILDLILKLDAMLELETLEPWIKESMLYELDGLMRMAGDYGFAPEQMDHIGRIIGYVDWLIQIESSPDRPPAGQPREMELKEWVLRDLAAIGRWEIPGEMRSALGDLLTKTRVLMEVEKIEGKVKRLAHEEALRLTEWAKATRQPEDVIGLLMGVEGHIFDLMVIEGMIEPPTPEEALKDKLGDLLGRLGRTLASGDERDPMIGLLELKLDALVEVEDVEWRLKHLTAGEIEMLRHEAEKRGESPGVLDIIEEALGAIHSLIEVEWNKGALGAGGTVVIDFESMAVGDAVEGPAVVHPLLGIDVPSGNAVVIGEGTAPSVYAGLADASLINGCVGNPGRYIADGSVSMYGQGMGNPDQVSDPALVANYGFTWGPGITAADFSVTMLDYGDFLPSGGTLHEVQMVAYDGASNVLDADLLTVTGGPTSAGDACLAAPGEPGVYRFSVSGPGIARVEVQFLADPDPNVAFDDIAFTPVGAFDEAELKHRIIKLIDEAWSQSQNTPDALYKDVIGKMENLLELERIEVKLKHLLLSELHILMDDGRIPPEASGDASDAVGIANRLLNLDGDPDRPVPVLPLNQSEEDHLVLVGGSLELTVPGSPAEAGTASGSFTAAPLGEPVDPDGDGRYEVQTEILSMDLTGSSSLLPVEVRITEDPARRSTARLVQQTPGQEDLFPVDSFFDVFLEVTTPAGVTTVDQPVRFEGAFSAEDVVGDELHLVGDIPLAAPSGAAITDLSLVVLEDLDPLRPEEALKVKAIQLLGNLLEEIGTGDHAAEIDDLVLKLDTLLELESVDAGFLGLVALELQYLDIHGGLPDAGPAWDILRQLNRRAESEIPPVRGPNDIKLKHGLLRFLEHAVSRDRRGPEGPDQFVDVARVHQLMEKVRLFAEVERIEVKLKRLILGEAKLLSERAPQDQGLTPSIQDTLDEVMDITWMLMALEGVQVTEPETGLKHRAIGQVRRAQHVAGEAGFARFSRFAQAAPEDIMLKLDAALELELVKLKIKASLLNELEGAQRQARATGESEAALQTLADLKDAIVRMVAIERGFLVPERGQEATLRIRAIGLADQALAAVQDPEVQALVDELGFKLQALDRTAEVDLMMKEAALRQIERLLSWGESNNATPEFMDTLQGAWETVRKLIAIETAPVLSNLDLAPDTASNTLGTSHVVTATAADHLGIPMEGVELKFSVSAGPNSGPTGTAVTDELGQASFSYSGTTAGTDTIRAWTGGLPHLRRRPRGAAGRGDQGVGGRRAGAGTRAAALT